jgi:predicted DNA-binding transcriptional regulator AlpA
MQDHLELVSKKQLAELLGVRPWTIDEWRKKNLIPAPIGLSDKTVRWRRVDIDLWLRERQAKPVKTRKVGGDK